MNVGNVEMNECSFEKIERKEGTGGITRGRVKEREEMIIENSSFDEIKGEKGN
jgi:hypothetical protein